MRNFTITRPATIAVLGASLALAACAGEAEDAAPQDENVAVEAEGSDLSGDEIAEAVPGVEDADPEGDTGNTADIAEDGNADYSDVGDPEED